MCPQDDVASSKPAAHIAYGVVCASLSGSGAGSGPSELPAGAQAAGGGNSRRSSHQAAGSSVAQVRRMLCSVFLCFMSGSLRAGAHASGA